MLSTTFSHVLQVQVIESSEAVQAWTNERLIKDMQNGIGLALWRSS